MATIHVKFKGTSTDVDLPVENLSDTEIKQEVGSHLDVPAGEFSDYEVERHTNGNITIRPQASFGK